MGHAARRASAWPGCPLLALSLRPWVEGGRLPRWAPPLAALAILSHPTMLPSVVALRGARDALCAPRQAGAADGRGRLAATVGLALALTAFWSLPLRGPAEPGWSRSRGATSRSGCPATSLRGPCSSALGVTALTAWVAVGLRRRPFDALLAALPSSSSRSSSPTSGSSRGAGPIEPQRLLDGVVQAVGLGRGARGRRDRRPAPARPGRTRAAGRSSRSSRSRLASDRCRIGAPVPPTVAVWPAAAAWPTLEEVTGPPPPRSALERAPRRNGPRPLPHLVPQASTGIPRGTRPTATCPA